MATISLPQNPNLEQLRHQARDLQRAVRSGDHAALQQAGLREAAADFGLSRAQLIIARRYGFSSWARLRRQVQAITARTWMFDDGTDGGSPSDEFVRLACLNYDRDDPTRPRQAVEILRRHPELPGTQLVVAAVSADVPALSQHLAGAPDAARASVGPFGWPPLMYVTYGRLDVEREAAVATVRLLLDAGADPNDGRFFGGLASPFTVLTGAFGGGEIGQPPHRHSIAIARELLAAGADANDGQTLYNRMFTVGDDFLELLFEFGLGQGDGGPWRRLLPDLLPAPPVLVRRLLHWAVLHDQRERVARLARHGVEVITPLDDGATPIDLALRNGHRRLVEQLRLLGAQPSPTDPVDAFISAALAGDADAVRVIAADVAAAARLRRPGLVVWAVGQQRIAAIDLLVAAGFDVNAFGRGDVPVEQEWQTALHTAVERDDPALVRHLLDLGADRTLRDARFDGTPADWADHLGHPEVKELLKP